MDALVFLSLALLLLITNKTPESKKGSSTSSSPMKTYKNLPTKLNPSMYDDEDAFMEMAHALGFRNDDTV